MVSFVTQENYSVFIKINKYINNELLITYVTIIPKTVFFSIIVKQNFPKELSVIINFDGIAI